jgi:hypothetical protein
LRRDIGQYRSPQAVDRTGIHGAKQRSRADDKTTGRRFPRDIWVSRLADARRPCCFAPAGSFSFLPSSQPSPPVVCVQLDVVGIRGRS